MEEIRSKGYKGGKAAFYDYLAKVKIDSKKDFTPYETAAGVQAQFDWSPYTVMISGELTKVYIYLYINSFSRYQIFDASLSENQGAVFEALEQSIIESKGVPARIQTDNAKIFISNASRYNFQWNKKYLHFCGHYGFQPSRSLPAHPWSKGKVEKPFSYLETHFIAGNSFESFEDLCCKLKDFQQKVNNRIHFTIRAAPQELIVEEEKYLSLITKNKICRSKRGDSQGKF